MKSRILVTGSLALDTIRTDEHFVKESVGGSVTYFSHAASIFSDVSVVAVAGSDFPRDFLKSMEQRGIDVSNIEIRDDRKSFHWTGSYENDFNEAETIDTELGVFAEFKPKLLDHQRKIGTLFLANIDPDIQLSLIAQSEASLIGADSMNYWISSKRDSLGKVLEKCNILFLNETEARMLSGRKKIFEAGRAILDMGPDAAVIKQGHYGVTLFYKDIYLPIPVYPTFNVIDPTGAGDSFAGGFMGYIARKNNVISEENLRGALVVGTITASYNIEGFSLSVLSKITIDDIKRRSAEFAKMLCISPNLD